MNDDLKAKLTSIIDFAIPGFAYEADDVSQARRRYFIGSIVDDVDKAYKDAGYEKLHEKGAYDTMTEAMKELRTERMTSREWYERLERTLDQIIATAPAPQAEILKVGRRGYLKIAKMAAGLEFGDD